METSVQMILVLDSIHTCKWTPGHPALLGHVSLGIRKFPGFGKVKEREEVLWGVFLCFWVVLCYGRCGAWCCVGWSYCPSLWNAACIPREPCAVLCPLLSWHCEVLFQLGASGSPFVTRAGLCSSKDENHHHLQFSDFKSQRVGIYELDSTIKTKQTEHRCVKGCYSNPECIIHSSLMRGRQEQMNFNHFRLMEIIFSAHVITAH